MQVTRRILVWFVETLLEALLLSVVLERLLGHDKHAFLKDLSIYSSGIVLLFFTTGYFLTTILARALWRGQTFWSYSGVAAALFLVHFEVMNVGLGGAFDPSDRLRVRVLGTCIVLACTLAGSLALRRWPPAHSRQVAMPSRV
jgi:hypothetical protein